MAIGQADKVLGWHDGGILGCVSGEKRLSSPPANLVAKTGRRRCALTDVSHAGKSILPVVGLCNETLF
jgi:hypothetical protein